MQVLKEEIKEKILDAALKKFAEKGFKDTTMADIAGKAGLSVGNLYLYYKNKTALFNTIISPDFIREFKEILFQKIDSVSGVPLDNIRETSLYLIASETMINFYYENRLKIIIAMENTKVALFSGLKDEIVNYLNNLFFHYLKSINKNLEPLEYENTRSLMQIIYVSLSNSILGILKLYEDKNDLQLNLQKLLDYHLSGLNSLVK